MTDVVGQDLLQQSGRREQSARHYGENQSITARLAPWITPWL